MADPTTDQPRVGPLALAEPTAGVRRGWIASLGLASLGMWMASSCRSSCSTSRPATRSSPSRS